jgi:hypothetical protein
MFRGGHVPNRSLLTGCFAIPLLLLSSLMFPALSLAASEPDAREILTTALQKKYAPLKVMNLDPAKQPRTRDLNTGALIAIVIENDPASAEAFLRRSYATQDMDPHSHSYGQLRWVVNDTRISDFNAIEFGSLPMGPMLLKYRDRLSPQFLQWLKPHLQASLAALKQHRVKTAYTNICLMNAVNLMLLGQATDDAAAVAEGERRIDDWIALTQKIGTAEFDSPTYYGTDLNSLTIGRHYVASESEKQKLTTILNYFWTDIAANYFAPGQRLAGPYSRDYDFLFGTGDLDHWLATAGLAPAELVGEVSPDSIYMLDNLSYDPYTPPDTAIALAHSGPRTVQSSWNASPMGNRWVWQGNGITMGCTSGSYGEQDKLFAATFAGTRTLPQVTVDVDAHDSPYGLYRRPDRSNHMKPVHLPPNFGSVQSGGIALLTLDLDPAKLPDDANAMTTNLIFPSQARIAADGTRFDSSTTNRMVVDAKSVVTISRNGATFAVRLLKADGTEREAESLALVADTEGLSKHAARLRLSNIAPGTKAASEHIRLVFVVAAADEAEPDRLVGELASAKLREDLNADTWRVSVKLPDKTLEVTRSATDRTNILSQKIDGIEVTPRVLAVNDKDITAQVWK